MTSQKRCALVIGGSRGIGAAIVSRLTHDGISVRFTFNGSHDAAERLAEATGATAMRSDAAERDAVVTAVRDSGALDILVVNAGVFIGGDPLTLDPVSVDHMFDVNIRAPYYASVEAARDMRAGGRIVLIGSTHGDRAVFAGVAAYAATKSAMQGMARGLARDFGPRGITVNVVQPGPTDTDMNPADGPNKLVMHSAMAIKQHGTSDEVAALVAFLVGPDARGITGATHTIDGGFGI